MVIASFFVVKRPVRGGGTTSGGAIAIFSDGATISGGAIATFRDRSTISGDAIVTSRDRSTISRDAITISGRGSTQGGLQHALRRPRNFVCGAPSSRRLTRRRALWRSGRCARRARRARFVLTHCLRAAIVNGNPDSSRDGRPQAVAEHHCRNPFHGRVECTATE